MKNVAVFVDVKNLYYNVVKKYGNQKVAYETLLDKIKDNHTISRSFAYGAHSNGAADKFIGYLLHMGFAVNYKDCLPAQCDWKLGIALDVVRIIDKIDKIILVTSDGGFYPLVTWIQEKGVECDIIGCNVHRDLKHIANKYIEIDSSFLLEQETDNG